MKKVKKVFLILLVGLLVITPISELTKNKTVMAATKVVTFSEYVKMLVKELNLETKLNLETEIVENAYENRENYLVIACTNGLVSLKEYDEKKDKELTRTDVAILSNRADEIINGKKYNKKMYKRIVSEKRISDINKITKSKRDSVIKIFEKGIMVGYFNGTYSQSRSFKGSKYVSITGAKDIIKKIKNKKLRSKLSFDGQLIRTTNLPKNYKNFRYILVAFPNSFYEKKFQWQTGIAYSMYYDKNGKSVTERVKYKEGYENNEYLYPSKNTKYPRGAKWLDNYMEEKEVKEMFDKYIEEWCQIIENNYKMKFNVDYRKLDNKWISDMKKTYRQDKYNPGYEKCIIRNLKKYIKFAKENKIIVEASKIVVEPSTLYYLSSTLYIRTVVKFRIVSNNYNYKNKNKKWMEIIHDLSYEMKDNLTNGKWYTIYIDQPMDGGTPGAKGESNRVFYMNDDSYR